MTEEKIRENRLRRAAARQGLTLHKSRTRDPRALDYGRWRISGPGVDVECEDVDQVEAYLQGERS